MNDSGLALFIRYPQPGLVKTRLAAVLGNEVAADLYGAFVLDLLDRLQGIRARILVFYDPLSIPQGRDPGQALREWLGNEQEFLPQSGGDLGERMENAFRQCFNLGLSRVALMGSDVPDYPPPLVSAALDELRRKDAVIGPALDGGYYLIGFSREKFLPGVFQGMDWGSSGVFARTMDLLQEAGLSILRLPDWIDVAPVRALNALWRMNRNSSFRESRTWKLLAGLEDMLTEYDREPAEILDEEGRPRDEARLPDLPENP